MVAAVLAWHGRIRATQPPAVGATFPKAYLDRLAVQPRAFTYKRALKDVAARAIVARSSMAQASVGTGESTKISIDLSKLLGAPDGSAPATRVDGIRSIPDLKTMYSDSAAQPYSTAKSDATFS